MKTPVNRNAIQPSDIISLKISRLLNDIILQGDIIPLHKPVEDIL